MSAAAVTWTCANCDATAPAEDGRLPRLWEYYHGFSGAIVGGPVWCGACIKQLLDDVVEAARKAFA